MRLPSSRPREHGLGLVGHGQAEGHDNFRGAFGDDHGPARPVDEDRHPYPVMVERDDGAPPVEVDLGVGRPGCVPQSHIEGVAADGGTLPRHGLVADQA